MMREDGGRLEFPLLNGGNASSSPPRLGISRALCEVSNGGDRDPEDRLPDRVPESAEPETTSGRFYDSDVQTHLRNAAGGIAEWVTKCIQNFTMFPTYVEEDRNANAIKRDKYYSYAFLFLAMTVVVGIYIFQQRAEVAFTERTNDPVPHHPALTCGCSTAGQDTGLLRSCYQIKSPAIETVTIVSFPNFTSPDLPNITYGGDLRYSRGGSSVQLVYKTINDAYLDSNTLTEFNLWIEDKKMLSPLYHDYYRYFEDMETVDYNIDHILDNTTLFEFPSYFMFMMVQFHCTKFSACSPAVILFYMGDPKLRSHDSRLPGSSMAESEQLLANSTAYVGNEWLTCGGYDGNSEWDPLNNFYRGRCMIYPTYPTMSARVKKLLYYLRSLSLRGDLSNLAGYFNRSNVVTFVSRMEQVNQSIVIDNVPMVMGYLEVEPGTAQWLRMADEYPGVRFECSAPSGTNSRAWTEVCNASSICLSYKTAAEVGFSSVKMTCMDFDRYNYTNCVLLANSTGNFDRVDELCNPAANCQCVPSRKVKRQVVSETALNQMNVKVVKNEIDTSSKLAVCRNVYAKVVRYYSQSLNRDVFLETNCSQAAGVCTITGKYNLLEDEAGAAPRKLDDKEVQAAAHDAMPFVCSGYKRQSWLDWAVQTYGVIPGWLMTLYTIANLFYSNFFVPATGHVVATYTPSESSSEDEAGEQDGSQRGQLEVSVQS